MNPHHVFTPYEALVNDNYRIENDGLRADKVRLESENTELRSANTRLKIENAELRAIVQKSGIIRISEENDELKLRLAAAERRAAEFAQTDPPPPTLPSAGLATDLSDPGDTP